MSSVTLQAVLKRALPFLAAFAVALFITSFFVDLNRPRFSRGHGGKRFQEMQRLRDENKSLKDENERLRERLGHENWSPGEYKHPGRENCPLKNMDVPPPAPVAPRAVE